MADVSAGKKPAQLQFLPTEDYETGMQVSEINFNPLGTTPLAPFNASRFTVEPGGSSPVDSHAVHEIWMVSEGVGELTYDDQTLRVKPADVFYFEPPKPHQVKNDGTETLVVFSVWWKG